MPSEEKQHWDEMGKRHVENSARRWEQAELDAQWDGLVERCTLAVDRLHGEIGILCLYGDVQAILDAERRLKAGTDASDRQM